MDKKAMYDLSYGVFMVASKSGEKLNGCITNTCIQAATNPNRVAICVINTNLTCDYIKDSGVFSVSMLDESCTVETIKYFGYQSGRDVDKFGIMKTPKDGNGVPYLAWQTCSVLQCKVVSSQDLGSHTLFIGEVEDAKKLSANAPLTYAAYQTNLKPKPAEKAKDKKIIGWRCKICKYYYEGEKLPEDFTCPLCGHGPEDFEPVYAE